MFEIFRVEIVEFMRGSGMWKNLIALAVTIPMSITIASAQHANDADISAYSQDLQMRINYGQQSGQLTPANYNSLQSLYNNVEMIRRSTGNKAMPPMVRVNMMNSLTNIDKQLTTYMHDDQNARWQNWDSSRNTWRNNWWTNSNNRYRLPGSGNNSGGNFGGGSGGFNDEIDAYQNNLRQRMNQGRLSGRISRSELAALSASYDNLERMQRQYRIGGYNSMERNSLMGLMTQFDRQLTAQLRDNNNSRYNQWNPATKSWNNSWWKNANGNGGIVPPDRNHDGRPDWNRDNDRNNNGRPDWKEADRNNNGRPDWKEADRNNNGRPDWKEADRNNNGRPDWKEGDRNNNGRPDWKEGDRNNNGRPDWNRGNDRNNDGRPDINHNTSPTRPNNNPSSVTTTPPVVTPPVTPSNPPVTPPVIPPTNTGNSGNLNNNNPRGNDGPRGGGSWNGTRPDGSGTRGDNEGGRGGDRGGRSGGSRPDRTNP
jgi:hypothetical protein